MVRKARRSTPIHTNPPAALVNQLLALLSARLLEGSYGLSAESSFMEFCLYYHMPCLSLRAAAYHLAQSGLWASRQASPHQVCGRLGKPFPIAPVKTFHWPPRFQGVEGFRVDNLHIRGKRGVHRNDSFFIPDGVHLYGPTGQR